VELYSDELYRWSGHLTQHSIIQLNFFEKKLRQNSEKVTISNLSQPLVFSVAMNSKRTHTLDPRSEIQCSYFNTETQAWEALGLVMVGVELSKGVTLCATTHLTALTASDNKYFERQPARYTLIQPTSGWSNVAEQQSTIVVATLGVCLLVMAYIVCQRFTSYAYIMSAAHLRKRRERIYLETGTLIPSPPKSFKAALLSQHAYCAAFAQSSRTSLIYPASLRLLVMTCSFIISAALLAIYPCGSVDIACSTNDKISNALLLSVAISPFNRYVTAYVHG
jgi:hypothetical protein